MTEETYDVTFLDVFQLDSNDKPIDTCKTSLHEDISIANGKYDIHYVINLLKQIENKCNSGKFNAKDLRFSLQESCKILRVKLEMERDFKQDDRVKTYRCDQCQEIYFVPKNMARECPICLKSKPKRISSF